MTSNLRISVPPSIFQHIDDDSIDQESKDFDFEIIQLLIDTRDALGRHGSSQCVRKFKNYQ